MRVMALVAHAFRSAIRAETAGELSNLISYLTILGVKGRGAALLASFKRSSSPSITKIWIAPWMRADIAAINPTGPAP
jgi:hypothetical protein